jgi:sialate O-acetylesterase
MNIRIPFATFLAIALTSLCAHAADLKFSSIFTDNMVLQRGVKVPVWGTAEAGDEISVTFDKQTVKGAADKDGHWKVELDSLEPGGPFELTAAGKTSVTLKNVLVGDVWICSGQSNMEFVVNGAINSKDEIAKADFPQIRHIKIAKQVGLEPKDSISGKWEVCSPQTVAGFTAVGFFFGRELHADLKVPIGLLHSSWGGTPAESWTSRETLEADPDLKVIMERSDWGRKDYPNQKEKYEQHTLKDWQAAAEKAKADGKPEPAKPKAPAEPDKNSWYATGLYNGMIKPLIPFAFKGVIWYQGESNAGRAFQYRKLFAAMIQDWRKQWGQEFPFFFVQLANYQARRPEPGDSSWAELREAQSMTLSLPKTGMAVIIDIGEEKDIHPKNKQDVGKRLALAAEAIAYGKDLEFSGPVYDSFAVEGNAVRIKFKHAAGLEAKGGGELKGFAIAGDDKKWVWAQAKIDGESVVVSSDKVQKPVAVRYAWADNPECNLYNKAALPASPFRTDDWDGITKNAK